MLLSCAVLTSSAALGNSVGSSAPSAKLGGRVSLTIPASSHQVYKVSVSAGDWIIGYAWKPGTHTAASTLRILPPSASDVASDAVATSTPTGILFYRAPDSGTYFCDFKGAPGTAVTRGLFTSRPVLALRVPSSMVISYAAKTPLGCTFTDPLYKYVHFDGPEVCFEYVSVSSSTDGVTWKTINGGMTDYNGVWACNVSGTWRKTYFRFDYGGSVYDMAAFGESHSATITVIPHSLITQSIPAKAKNNVVFGVRAWLQPRVAAGQTNVTAEAYKKGTSAVLSFPATAFASKSGPTPLKASVTLPSAGTWYVRFHRTSDGVNADSATKWVTVAVS